MKEQGQIKTKIIILLGASDHVFHLLKHALGSEPYDILSIAADRSYLGKIPEMQPDLVLISEEVEMPEALMFARELRKLFADDPVPVILTLRRADSESIFNAFESGATDYARAPVRWDLLRYKIKRCIEERGRSKTLLQQASEMVFDMVWKLHTLSESKAAYILVATLYDNAGRRMTTKELLMLKSGLLASSHGTIQTVPVEDYLVAYSDRQSHIQRPEMMFDYIKQNIDIVGGFRAHAAGMEVASIDQLKPAMIHRILLLIMHPDESDTSTFIQVPSMLSQQMSA